MSQWMKTVLGPMAKKVLCIQKQMCFLWEKNSPIPSSPIDNAKCQTPPTLQSQEINSISMIACFFFLKVSSYLLENCNRNATEIQLPTDGVGHQVATSVKLLWLQKPAEFGHLEAEVGDGWEIGKGWVQGRGSTCAWCTAATGSKGTGRRLYAGKNYPHAFVCTHAAKSPWD